MITLRTIAALTLATLSHAAPSPQQLADLIQSEDLALDLTPQLDSFATSLLTSAPLPAPPQTTGLATFSPDTTPSDHPWLATASWPLAPTKTDPWAALHTHIATWSDARFGIKSATLTRGARPAFEMLTSFEGRGTTTDKKPFAATATQTIVWHHDPDRGWLLHTWQQHSFELAHAPKPLFTESLALALPDPAALTKAQRSIKDEMVAHTVSTGETKIPGSTRHLLPYVDPESGHSFPSCQVVDIDSDSWDDLFLTSRWGHTQLLRNKTDGTFEEVSEKWNLRRPYLVNTALFFDADNDGDPDAILGGAMAPAEFLINDGTSFTNATATHTDLGDQHFVAGISASDVNRDGLLDLYLATYAPAGTRKVDWTKDFLTETERTLYQKHRADDHRWLNHRGSANILLMNRGGGKLERVPYDQLLSQWRFSHTSAWADYDGDGD
ncbi:MAG: VCBS repeat-containing protein, partial [Verrucomicrobiales bacterium]|nr:VCBS repeat-containing protein [Verrucomicrobiales bacterium]